jgi:hypothetical protein
MESEGLLTCSQEPCIDPYPEPDKSSPCHRISKIHFNYTSTYVLVFLVVSFFWISHHSCYMPYLTHPSWPFTLFPLCKVDCVMSHCGLKLELLVALGTKPPVLHLRGKCVQPCELSSWVRWMNRHGLRKGPCLSYRRCLGLSILVAKTNRSSDFDRF